MAQDEWHDVKLELPAQHEVVEVVLQPEEPGLIPERALAYRTCNGTDTPSWWNRHNPDGYDVQIGVVAWRRQPKEGEHMKETIPTDAASTKPNDRPDIVRHVVDFKAIKKTTIINRLKRGHTVIFKPLGNAQCELIITNQPVRGAVPQFDDLEALSARIDNLQEQLDLVNLKVERASTDTVASVPQTPKHDGWTSFTAELPVPNADIDVMFDRPVIWHNVYVGSRDFTKEGGIRWRYTSHKENSNGK